MWQCIQKLNKLLEIERLRFSYSGHFIDVSSAPSDSVQHTKRTPWKNLALGHLHMLHFTAAKAG